MILPCPNCECCEATEPCDGCSQYLCFLCYMEHNEEWPDHTEHVAVMQDRSMSEAEIQRDLAWHRDNNESTPDYKEDADG